MIWNNSHVKSLPLHRAATWPARRGGRRHPQQRSSARIGNDARRLSKNICSVRHRPIRLRRRNGARCAAVHAAFRRWPAPSGGAPSSAHPIRVLKSPDNCGLHGRDFTQHAISSPTGAVDGDHITIAAALNPFTRISLAALASMRSWCRRPADTGAAHAARHHRGVRLVMPPRAVRMPLAACMPWISSGWFRSAPGLPHRLCLGALFRAVIRIEHDLAQRPHRGWPAGLGAQHIARRRRDQAWGAATGPAPCGSTRGPPRRRVDQPFLVPYRRRS